MLKTQPPCCAVPRNPMGPEVRRLSQGAFREKHGNMTILNCRTEIKASRSPGEKMLYKKGKEITVYELAQQGTIVTLS